MRGQEKLVYSSRPLQMGGLNVLLRCNYNVKYFDQLPFFYKTILESFSELKTLYGYDQLQDLVLFNNKDILVGGRPTNGIRMELFSLMIFLMKTEHS